MSSTVLASNNTDKLEIFSNFVHSLESKKPITSRFVTVINKAHLVGAIAFAVFTAIAYRNAYLKTARVFALATVAFISCIRETKEKARDIIKKATLESEIDDNELIKNDFIEIPRKIRSCWETASHAIASVMNQKQFASLEEARKTCSDLVVTYMTPEKTSAEDPFKNMDPKKRQECAQVYALAKRVNSFSDWTKFINDKKIAHSPRCILLTIVAECQRLVHGKPKIQDSEFYVEIFSQTNENGKISINAKKWEPSYSLKRNPYNHGFSSVDIFSRTL